MVQMEVIERSPYLITEISNSCEAIQTMAVEKNPYAIMDIQNSTEMVQMAAVQKVPYTIKYIKEPSETVQMEVIKQNPYLIGEISNPCEKAQLMAVQKNPELILQINNPSEEVQSEAIRRLYKEEIAIDFSQNSGEKINNLIKSLNEVEETYEKRMLNLNTDYDQKRMEDWRHSQRQEILDHFKEEIELKATEFDSEMHMEGSDKVTLEDTLIEMTSNEEVKDIETDKPVSIEEKENTEILTQDHEAQITSNESIKDVEIETSGSRTLIGDITEDNGAVSISNLRIKDATTGKIEQLQSNGIDLSNQSSETIKKLLSGQKVETTSINGISDLIGLNKTPLGWGLTISKQLYGMAEASAEI
ncbi:hypothetical protein ACIXIL_20820 [Bacteroides fragilis]